MNKYIFLIFLIVSIGFASQENVIITKRVYPDVSKNAIFEAAKNLFALSNKENKNRDFLINSYRNKLEVEQVIFQNRIISVDLFVDKWLMEVHEFENESRVNLLVLRRNALDLDDNKEVKISIHNLFWDRLEYLLGLRDTWIPCSNYFSSDLASFYCHNFLLTDKPDDKFISKNISILKEKQRLNTIDSIKADIFDKTDLNLKKENNNIFEQNEEIFDTNILTPIMENMILETKAVKVVKEKEMKNKDENAANGEKEIKEEMQNSDESIDQFKNEMKDIVNKKSSLNDSDIEKIITESNELKENSEFSLDTK